MGENAYMKSAMSEANINMGHIGDKSPCRPLEAPQVSGGSGVCGGLCLWRPMEEASRLRRAYGRFFHAGCRFLEA